MTIEIGTVVKLKGGGPWLTIVSFRVHDNEASPMNGNSCDICGAFPRIESSEGQVVATMLLAQQQWRTRHDAHVKLDGHMEVTCMWMYDGEARSETFPLEALVEVSKEDLEDPPSWRRRHRHRRRHYRAVRVGED